MSEFKTVFEDLQRVFQEATKEREHRPLDQSKLSHECGWVLYEREQMHTAVSRWRQQLGLGPVSLPEVERAERLACGHSDYYRKFPLYCAELAVGRTARP